MHVFLALPYYLMWHYSVVYSDMKNIWKNFFVFLFNFFSVSTLLRTLFSPWHRIAEGYDLSFDRLIGTLIVNLLMRAVGVFIRGVFILFWGVSTLFCFIFGLLFFIVWTLLPFILILSVLEGVNLLTS